MIGLVIAAIATFSLVQVRAALDRAEATPGPFIERGKAAPPIVGRTLDGETFDLAALRGTPVIVNFWGPSCIPCRDEFPLFKTKLTELGAANLAIVGVLMDDPVAPARDFVTEYGASWPTVEDGSGAIRAVYRVAARPQSYFIDREGVLRAIQVGQLTDAEFARQYALISGEAAPVVTATPGGFGSQKPFGSREVPPPP
ncbi:MAG TPA: TlpA disulfide reductase family protein [Candidatus Limnocylindria bacterium]|nr:TlpA disulfide reductase family protein [Candidatus Limnocylindria bacterium]